LTLLKEEDFPTWDAGFVDKKVIIYLKYTISDGASGNCGNWNAHSYTINSVNNNYLVSQATGNFAISQ
jgi:hypothetical protein